MTTAIQTKNQAAYTVVSRHNTSRGQVTYVRCNSCHALRMVLPGGPWGDGLSAGRHTDRCPNCD